MTGLRIDDIELRAAKPTDDLVKGGRYVIPDPDTGVTRRWTRSSQFGKVLTDNYMLGRWKERMVALGLVARPDLLNLISVTTDKEKINEYCTQAKEAAGSSRGANTGTFIHSVTEALDRGQFPAIRSDVQGDVGSYMAEMRRHNLHAIREYIERVIVCKPLGCAGRFDRVLRVVGNGVWAKHPHEGRIHLPAGTLLIGDVKTAQNIGYSWLEVSVQLALYANATKIYNPGTKTFEDMPDVSKRFAVVMSIPAGAKRCDLYWIDIEAGLELAHLARTVRTARNTKNLAGRLEPADEPLKIPSAEGVDWWARIDEATCRADLSTLWQEAESRGEWSQELEAYGLNRAEELRG